MTTQVLAVTDVAYSVGVSVASPAVILDDASDSTWATFTGYSTAWFDLDDHTLPTGARTKTIRCYTRSKEASQVYPMLWVSYSTLDLDEVQLIGFTPLWYAYSDLTSPPRTLPELSQAQVDNLRIGITQQTEFVSASTRLSELTVSLTYAERPTAAITYPVSTPAIGLSSPTVTWTHTAGSDGGPQVYYEVKVFTAAQYGAGGFSADTSTPEYTSGVVTSPASSVQIGPLANSTTYRVYVRTAQVVNSAAHWSAWDFEGFTTNFADSEITSVTPVATSPSGLMTVTVARNTGTETWDTVEVERSDDAGVTWLPVRGATNLAVGETNTFVTTFSSTSLVVKDYEAPNGVSVLYRARAMTNNSGSDIIGPWTTSSAVSWASQPGWVWLKDPHNPTLNVMLNVQEMPNPTRPITQGIDEIIGSELVNVISDVRRGVIGTFVAMTTSKLDGATLDSATASPFKLMQFPASHLWGSKYVALGDIQEMHLPDAQYTDAGYRLWRIAYVEIARPADHTDY